MSLYLYHLIPRPADTASEKQGSINSKESNVSSVRANELDRLVEAGDWEGVVLAAAKFDGASDAGSVDDESLSEKRDKSEIQAEVEALVRRVVPDEIGEFIVARWKEMSSIEPSIFTM